LTHVQHDRVNYAEEVYDAGDVHMSIIEGFWSLLKRGIGGVYHSVSAKHLQGYLDEYAFRYNHRDDPGGGCSTPFLVGSRRPILRPSYLL